MISSTSSFSQASRPQPFQRPSVTSRLSFAVSTAERGEGPPLPEEQRIEEEIAEIKRYEVRVHSSDFVFSR